MTTRLLAITIAILTSSTAHAEEPEQLSEVEIARRLFEEGRALYQKAKYIEACVLFEKSYQLDPAVGTQLNLAECAERQGNPRAAWLSWVGAATEFERQSDDRASFARKRADALAPKLATLIVRVARPRKKGLVITINDRVVEPSASIVERTDARRIKVIATAPKRVRFETTVEVAIGEQDEIEIPALARPPGTARDEDDGDPPDPKPWVIAASIGGATMVASFGFTFFAGHKVREFEAMTNPPDLAERDRQGEKWASIGRVTGLIFLGATVATGVLVVKAVFVKRARRRALTGMVPVVGPGYAGVSVRW